MTTGQAVEASLGYFINPLVSVLLGVFVLKEKLRPLQWAAVGIGFIAVGVLTYLLRQAALDRPDAGVQLWPVRLREEAGGAEGGRRHQPQRGNRWCWPRSRPPPWSSSASAGAATLTTQGAGHFWLLVASGVITAVPLLFFGASARRLPMTTIGLLQYFAPVLQFIVALVVFQRSHDHWTAGSASAWCGWRCWC